MNVTLIGKFLLYLSKTDVDVLKHCTKYAVYSRMALGSMVLFTGILAFFSGSYAVSTMFQDFNPVTKSIDVSNVGIAISVLIGSVYCLMIVTFDREIVSVTNRTAALIRLSLAIVIGFVVALPLELKLLEGGVDKQLALQSKEENKNDYERRVSAIDALNTKTAELEANVQKEKDEIAKWKDAMEAEVVGRVKQGRTGKAGEGPAFREAKQNMELHQKFLEQAQNQLQQHQNNYPLLVIQITEEYKTQEIEQEYDLLTRIEALETIKSNSSAAAWMAWGVRILLILIEMFPALAKIFLQPSEYDAMLEARRRLNHQITNAISNKGLKEIEQNVNNAYNPQYIKDIKKNIMQ